MKTTEIFCETLQEIRASDARLQSLIADTFRFPEYLREWPQIPVADAKEPIPEP